MAGLALILISCATISKSEETQPITTIEQLIESPPIEQVVVVDVQASAETLKDREYLALTIWGEARGESDADMAKVGSVIINRTKSKKYPSTIEEVVLQPGQFNVWSRKNPNYVKLVNIHELDRTSMDWKAYKRAKRIADQLLTNGPVIKALSFHSKQGYHIFY